jgi:hypothetical protein
MKHKIASRIVVLSVLLALIFSVVGVKPAQADTTPAISENFDSPISGWTMLGSAAQDTGWLQLTPALPSLAGVAFYNTAYPTAGNVFDIRFDYATYGGTGADGLAFFMIDGSKTPVEPGGAECSLGYTGIEGGYFAVGFDEEGGFGGTGGENVAIRGDTASGNPRLVAVPTSIQTTSRADAKHARIVLSNNKVSVWINGTLLIDAQQLTSSPPATVKFGFSGLTIGLTNIHEVDNFTVYERTPTIMRVIQGGATTFPCGNSWETACSLQTSLTNAISGDEIWVAQGLYRPTTGTDRSATFQLVAGVAVYGGFSGDETRLADRHRDLNRLTILNGDIGIVDNKSDNSYHVVRGTTGATLDGFTISSGNADGGASPDCYGGGMINWPYSSPTVTNIIFQGNSARSGGGGMFNSWYSNPIITEVDFIGNSAPWGGGMELSSSNPTVKGVQFIENSAKYGGGMHISSGSPTLSDVNFFRNSATLYGGGLFNSSKDSPTITNGLFQENSAFYGGGLVNFSSATISLDGSQFLSNKAGTTGDGYGGAINNGGDITITNTEFKSNQAGVEKYVGQGQGGAIYNSNILSVESSFFEANQVFDTKGYNWLEFKEYVIYGQGGAIYSKNGTTTVTSSIFKGNISTLAPAYGEYSSGIYVGDGNTTDILTSTFDTHDFIYNVGTKLSITNSTVWTQIFSRRDLEIDSSTVYKIKNFHGEANLKAINTIAQDCQSWFGATIDSNNNSSSITQTNTSILFSTCGMTYTPDIKLDNRDWNSGKGYFSLQPSSPALNAANTCSQTTDQRGVMRPQGSACDIGAYEAEEFTLTIISGYGTVTKSPDQATYHYGDVVTLSVTPEPGWTFTDWTPPLTNNQVMIAGNMTVTANYLPDEYVLTITSYSELGTVTKNPDKPTYRYGDVVELTVMPNAGVYFGGWGGDLTGMENPVSITIRGPTNIEVLYAVPEHPDHVLTINSDHGAVMKNPDQATYHNGDVVTLSVTPEPGWTFMDWTPSLTDNQVKITGDTIVTANYKQQTNINLDPQVINRYLNEAADFTATLTDSDGQPLGDKNILFLVKHNDNMVYSETITTAGSGQAMVSIPPQPIGQYTVEAYFGQSPLDDLMEDPDFIESSATATLNVIYNFGGFLPPIADLPILNQAIGGSAIPIKFTLGGAEGLEVFIMGYPASQLVDCTTGSPLGSVEQNATPGSSSLSYNENDERYTFIWKTDKAWRGTCRMLILKFDDGTKYMALFKLK